MKSRPKTLIALAAFNLAVALALPLQIMIIYGHPLSEWTDIASKLTVFNWLVMVVAMANAAFIFNVSRSTLFLTPMVFAIVAINNFFVSLYATDYSAMQAGLAVMSFAVLHFPLVTSANFALLNNRKLHFWRTAPRRQVSLPVSLGDSRHWAVHTNTFDLSESGVFVELDAAEVKAHKEWDHQKDFRVRVNLGGDKYVTCDAKVVRRATETGRYPTGLGIHFHSMPYSDRRALRRALGH